MDVSRLCGVQGGTKHTTHQRVAEYVKRRCDQYPGMPFTPREEWLIEQTIAALHQLLADTRCSEVGRMAVSAFLDIAAEELPGSP
jgi:hypothetical protein